MFSLSIIMGALGCNKGIAYYKKQLAVLDTCNASLLLITAELLISHHCFERMSSNWGRSAEGVFGPRKENNSLKGPCWIIWLQRKQNRILGPALMLQAGCICLGLITPCPETFHPLHLPGRLITPCPTTNATSTKKYPKHPTWLMFPLSLLQASLQIWSLPDPSPRSAWSVLLAWVKVTDFCWGHLSSFCLGPNYTLHLEGWAI